MVVVFVKLLGQFFFLFLTSLLISYRIHLKMLLFQYVVMYSADSVSLSILLVMIANAPCQTAKFD
jgi:hypothetical protein